MMHINLLPGADKRRRKQEFIKLLSIAFSIFGLAAIGFGIIVAIIFSQNLVLKSQISKVEDQITEQDSLIAGYQSVIQDAKLLKNKLGVINELLAKYNNWGHFLTSLKDVIPSQGVRFVSLLVNEDKSMQINGIAASPVRLAELLAVLKKADISIHYTPSTNDSLASLVRRFKTSEEVLLDANQVINEKLLLARPVILIPSQFFESIEVTSISPRSEDEVLFEVERNVNFTLSITLSENAL
ncbi:MAG TPA: hypothetical protein ENN77_01890 [Candidatus Wirthbacteria bacterium]|nr:hypothetical protein [Candidatus Wirthbacteria bacterium]